MSPERGSTPMSECRRSKLTSQTSPAPTAIATGAAGSPTVAVVACVRSSMRVRVRSDEFAIHSVSPAPAAANGSPRSVTTAVT
jgi:hypothetical protein